MSRTMNVQVTNWSGVTLTFQDAQSTEGPKCTANMQSVGNGGTLTTTAYNDSMFYGGNEGTFVLSNNSNVSYNIYYTHPQTGGATYVQLNALPSGYTPAPSCIAGLGQPTYSGNPVTATMNLYQGVSVSSDSSTPGYAVPLASDPYSQANNCQDFANSMFGPNMRASSLVTNAFNQTTTPFTPADFSGQLSTLVDTLYALWIAPSGPSTSNNPDWLILQCLANYIAPGNGHPTMQMWVPEISYQGGDPSVYELTGYQAFPLASYSGTSTAWDETNLKQFLMLLAGGAHFVAISADADFTSQGIDQYDSRPLYTYFSQWGIAQREDFANSHYKGSLTYNNTGLYYLNITDEWAPRNCGLILSLLFGSTVNGSRNPPTGQYNTFMQLEGWPASGATGGDRHSTDYDNYKQTLWNISTYGAAPYSEKRATTVFLAPVKTTPDAPQWTPQVYQTTRMMPYVGAYATGTYPNGSPQGWLNTDVVTIASTAPTLPAGYYVS